MAFLPSLYRINTFSRHFSNKLGPYKFVRKRASSTLSYCVNLVKNCDNENYFCNLLLPDSIRGSAFAIRAFNIEMARVQENVTEKDIMPVRFKFWDDSINGIYDNKPINHPVIIELHKAVKRHKLSKIFLKRLITARLKQVNNSTFKDMAEMELYANQTTAPIYMLLLEASGIKDVNCDHVASHLGVAQGIANLVRGLPHNMREHLIMMPMSILMKHKVSEESVLRFEVNQDALNNIVHEVTAVAFSHLKIARSLKNNVPTNQRILFLPAIAVHSFLERLEICDFNVFSTFATGKNVLLPLKLYMGKLFQDY